MILLVFLLLPFILLNILSYPASKLRSSNFKHKYGELYAQIKLDYEGGYFLKLFYLFFLLHRYLFIFCVFFYSSGYTQTISLILFTFLILIYLMKTKPFLSKIDNLVAIFNYTFLLFVYILSLVILVVNSNSLSTHELLGFVIIGIVALLIVFNLSLIIVTKGCEVCQKCRRRERNEFDTSATLTTSTIHVRKVNLKRSYMIRNPSMSFSHSTNLSFRERSDESQWKVN